MDLFGSIAEQSNNQGWIKNRIGKPINKNRKVNRKRILKQIPGNRIIDFTEYATMRLGNLYFKYNCTFPSFLKKMTFREGIGFSLQSRFTCAIYEGGDAYQHLKKIDHFISNSNISIFGNVTFHNDENGMVLKTTTNLMKLKVWDTNDVEYLGSVFIRLSWKKGSPIVYYYFKKNASDKMACFIAGQI